MRSILSLNFFCLELEACTKANEELQKLREVAEAREAATEEKLRLEQQAQRGTIQKSYGCIFSVVSLAWADQAGCFFSEAEDQAAQGQAMLDRLSRPLEANHATILEIAKRIVAEL